MVFFSRLNSVVLMGDHFDSVNYFVNNLRLSMLKVD